MSVPTMSATRNPKRTLAHIGANNWIDPDSRIPATHSSAKAQFRVNGIDSRAQNSENKETCVTFHLGPAARTITEVSATQLYQHTGIPLLRNCRASPSCHSQSYQVTSATTITDASTLFAEAAKHLICPMSCVYRASARTLSTLECRATWQVRLAFQRHHVPHSWVPTGNWRQPHDAKTRPMFLCRAVARSLGLANHDADIASES
jgi:hypothetical protein